MKKKFEDMKIGGKLVAAFAIIIFLYIVTIITVIANINSMNERTQLLYDEPFANVESSLWMIANRQSDALAQIRKSIELISEIVQGNSATSEESAAASEELSAQAQVLKEMVEQFEF